MTQPSVPPGWYTDPLAPSFQRYWNGQEWTKQVRSGKKHPRNPWPASFPPVTPPPAVLAAHKRTNYIAGGVVAAIIIAIIIAVAVHKDSPSSGKGSDAEKLVLKTTQNAHAFATDTSALLVEIFAAMDTADDSALYAIATDARELRGHVDDFYDQVTTAVDLSDEDQSLMLEGLREVRAGIGTVQRWVDKPSPSLTDRWEHELETGIGQWNHAVKAIWSKANVSDVPTIDLPSS